MAGDGLVSIKNHNLLSSDGETEEINMTRTYMDAHGMPSFQSMILRRVKIAAIHPDFI